MNKYVRFEQLDSGRVYYGVIEGSKVQPLDASPWSGGKPTGNSQPLKGVKLLAPTEPTKIVCIGLNYHAHVDASQSADEAPENPLIFLKPPSSIIADGDNIVHPKVSERVDYEAELGIVIGARARNVKATNANDYIFGFTCVNDVTARDLQKKDGQWSRAKGFDTFCPVGPWIIDELDYNDILVEGIHNGEVRQSGRTSQMIFKIPYLIEYISSAMTLMPGDLVSTGTPSGIAPMKDKDTIAVKIEGIGQLTNSLVETE